MFGTKQLLKNVRELSYSFYAIKSDILSTICPNKIQIYFLLSHQCDRTLLTAHDRTMGLWRKHQSLESYIYKTRIKTTKNDMTKIFQDFMSASIKNRISSTTMDHVNNKSDMLFYIFYTTSYITFFALSIFVIK